MAGPVYIADPPEAVRVVRAGRAHRAFPSALGHDPYPRRSGAADTGGAGRRARRRGGDRRADGETFEVESDDAEAAIEARLAELEAAGLVRRA